MSTRSHIGINGAFEAIIARDHFVATLSVQLADWLVLDAASWWCEGHWLERGLHYRRRLDVDRRQASFDFSDDDHAIEFLMRFGSECMSLT